MCTCTCMYMYETHSVYIVHVCTCMCVLSCDHIATPPRDATGKFPDYPDDEEGGSEAIFKKREEPVSMTINIVHVCVRKHAVKVHTCTCYCTCIYWCVHHVRTIITFLLLHDHCLHRKQRTKRYTHTCEMHVDLMLTEWCTCTL